MKQSSIEWLLFEQRKVYSKFARGEYSVCEYQKEIEKLNNKAKQMHKQEMIEFGKKCFYKGFEKCETDDANCFTAWREEVPELLKYKSEEDETK